jgi:hypothetical protein
MAPSFPFKSSKYSPQSSIFNIQSSIGMAGAGGLEPPNAGTKTLCLATWRRPITHYPLSVYSCIRVFVMVKSAGQLGVPAMPQSQAASSRRRFISDQLQGSVPQEIIASPYPPSDSAWPISPFRHCQKGQTPLGRFHSSAHRLPQDSEVFL